jgi:hypothetical protein
MERPQLIRAALLALPADAEACLETLQFACWILDTPLPARILGPAQWRSL